MDDRSAAPHRTLPPISGIPSKLESTKQRLKQKRHGWKKDALTGLHGQRYLCHAIDSCLQNGRSRGLSATLALLQLENFYEIRTWVGIAEADLLLADIAQLLKKALPKRVLLCRCHNYEFAALLLSDASVNAGAITGKLKQALLRTVSPVLPPQLELKCGVGLAKLESNIPSWPVVFARARHNLRLAHYHGELPAALSSIAPDVALEQLHAALAHPMLTLNYQAWAHFDDESPQHYELRCALSGEVDSLPSALLFETAARNALGEKLDRRIIEQALGRLGAEDNSRLRLVINLSHNSVVSLPFLHWLEERLANVKTIAAQIVFQLSETDALIAQHHLTAFCQVIEKLGCQLSLSNFGCTPNPLRYLSLVPARYVKLDADMLNKLGSSQEQPERLTTLCTELHSREIAVVAPMLEQDSLLPILWQARVDYLQGNCLQAPTADMRYAFIETHTVCVG